MTIEKTRAGWLTPYALSCGSIEMHDNNGVRTILKGMMAHKQFYVVSQYDFNEGKNRYNGSFKTVNEARKQYRKLIK